MGEKKEGKSVFRAQAGERAFLPFLSQGENWRQIGNREEKTTRIMMKRENGGNPGHESY